MSMNHSPAEAPGFRWTPFVVLAFVALWPTVATVTCPNPPPPFNTFAPAAFFGGSKGALGVEAAGTVSSDGKTISGSDTNTQGVPVTFTWNFTRN